MTTYARCSDCSEQIPASLPRCPVCLRERSREEIFESISGKSPAHAGARTRPLSAVFWALLAVGVVYGGMRHQRHKTARAAEAARLEKEAAAAEKNRWEKEEAERTRRTALPPEDSRVGVMALSDSEPVQRPRPRSESPGRGEPGETGKPAVRETDAAWTVSGEVYDLLSLKPVRGLRLTFRPASGGAAVRAETDAKGFYRVRLPKDAGAYTLGVRHRRYDGTYVEESSLSFKAQARERRLDHYRTFRQSPVLHVPLSPPPGEDALEHSFAMLPD